MAGPLGAIDEVENFAFESYGRVGLKTNGLNWKILKLQKPLSPPMMQNLWERIILYKTKNIIHTGCFWTVSPIIQYQNEKNASFQEIFNIE